jgi:hypothetical protein
MEKLGLIYLDSIHFYFCEITGLFYSELFEGEQAYSKPQVSIERFIDGKDARLKVDQFMDNIRYVFKGISSDDMLKIYQCFWRKTQATSN